MTKQLSLNSSSSGFSNISESRYFAQVVTLDYQIIVKNSSGRLLYFSATQDILWQFCLCFQLDVSLAQTLTACFRVTVMATATPQEAAM